MADPAYIPAVPERSHIHVDGVQRRHHDAAPSIDAVYERSRRHRGSNDHHHQSRRSSRQLENGVGREGRRPSMENGGVARRQSESYEGRRASVTHPNQVHPAAADRGSRQDGHDVRRLHYGRNTEYYYEDGHQRGTAAHREYDDEDEDHEDDRYVVPALPMPMAIICCVLNFLLPGFGSMVAGISVLCCARTEGMSCKEKGSSCCTVFGIGMLQLLLVACFLIGWIWSCIWGVTFIGMSASYDDEYEEEYEYYAEAPPRQRHVPTGNTPLPTPEVVVDQPFPGIRYEDLQRQRERERDRDRDRDRDRNRDGERRQRTRSRRTISRIALTPSNFIYPMRAPSSIHYSSPPPPYKETATPPPDYWRNTPRNTSREAGRSRQAESCTRNAGRQEANNSRANQRQSQPSQATIYEEPRQL